jgi:homoserine O-acetyltransferase
MNAQVEPLTAATPQVARLRPAEVRDGILRIPGPLPLYHGGALRDAQLAWRITGASGAPIVCALGGISSHRRVCLTEEERDSWWPLIAGPGRALDSRRVRILSFDYLGSSADSSGPEPGGTFPSISTYDQAEALRRILDHLGIESLRAIAGGSYGGMVALAFAQRQPDRVAQLLVIGACDRPNPMSTAWRSIQRRIVRLAIESGRASAGIELARALAMTTYRSAEEFAARFDEPPSREHGQFVFAVERYLMARGRDYAARHRAEAFLCLSESIDLHRVDAAAIFVPTTAVAVREDQLVPLVDVRAMAARLARGHLQEISSVYGHDAFLKEAEQLRGIFASALGNAP